jgi:cytochrome P450
VSRWVDSWSQKPTADPYPNYAWMRGRGTALPRPAAAGGPTDWYITDYETARQLLLDERVGVVEPADGRQVERYGDLLDLEGEEHRELRRTMTAPLSPAALREFDAELTGVVEACVERAAARDESDWIREVAIPIPTTAIELLLGVPEDLRWDGLELFSAFIASEFATPADPTAAEAIASYTSAVAERGTGAVLEAMREAGCTPTQLEANTFMLLGAGMTTSVPLLGALVYRAFEAPEILAEGRTTPGFPEAFVNEVARLDGPVQLTVTRYAYEPVELDPEARIQRGDRVLLMLAAADRDPEVFEGPDRLVVGRSKRSLAFGHGRHVCLGAHLARLEGSKLLGLLAPLFGRYRIAPEHVLWGLGPKLRGPVLLPVVRVQR